MVEAGSLPRILKLVEREYAGTLAAYHFCPFCSDGYGSKPTMRIFPALHGDFWFRCHQCGMNYDSFELISEHRKELCYEEISNLMEEKGIVLGGYPPDELIRYEWTRRLRNKFNDFHRVYEHLVLKGELNPWPGDWGYLFDYQALSIFPQGMLGKIRYERYLVSRIRNICGKVISLELYSHDYRPLAYVQIQPREPVSLVMPGWTDYTDLTEIIIAGSFRLLNRLERVVSKWPPASRLPIAWVRGAGSPTIAYRQPFHTVWMIRGADAPAEAGLVFHRAGETEVRVRKLASERGVGRQTACNLKLCQNPASIQALHRCLPRNAGCSYVSGLPATYTSEEELPADASRGWLCSPDLPTCMEVVGGKVLDGQQGTIGSRLNEVLSKSFLSEEVKRELFEYCCSRGGISRSKLIRELDPCSSPYALRSQGRLFVNRNGIYFMRDRHERWQEISNFSLSITEFSLKPNGDKTYELMLSIDHALTTFKVTAAVLENSSRLWREANRAAALARLPEMIMPNVQHRRLLPSLTKKTAGLHLKEEPDEK